MDEFDLDLRTIEEELDDEADGDLTETTVGGVELGVLDGTTDPTEWIAAIEAGRLLVLDVQGDLNELAARFARDVYEMDGELVHFRGFLIVTPPGLGVDTDRVG